MQHVTAADARSFVEHVLAGIGVSKDNAVIVAKCLVEADLRGVDTHGINRIPSYMARIREGVLDASASPTVYRITPAVAQVDAHNGFGFLAAHTGMEIAIEMARDIGIEWLQQALDANMMNLVFTNSSPALPVWGGKFKLMGVSPIACGAPAGKGRPFIMDMAPSVAARGKIYKALRRQEKIPGDWALDKDGRQTQDPAKALEGVMLPMGGPKGSAIAIMMDIFSGVLSGSAFAGHVINPYDPSKPADRMDYLYQRVVGSDRMTCTDRIYFPGESEELNKEKRLKDGIPLVAAEVEALNMEAQRVGAASVPTSPPPAPRSRFQDESRKASPLKDAKHHAALRQRLGM
ncbi:hypothetical protein E8E11_001135 [Didymella keratinophila]|nr:hypothetical protein E8E11_001135 [Didymella keratinophila]